MSRFRLAICLSALLISLNNTKVFAEGQVPVSAYMQAGATVPQNNDLNYVSSDVPSDMEQLSTMKKEDGEYLPKKFFSARYLLNARVIKPEHAQEKLEDKQNI